MDLRPAARIVGKKPYRVPRAATPMDLFLDGNEGVSPPEELLRWVAELSPEVLRRYPSTSLLEAELAEHLGVRPEEVLVTAGADDALDRIARAVMEGGRNMVVAAPTFEMIPRYGAMAGGEIRRVPGDGPEFPLRELLEAVDEATALVVAITPNNPTGVVAHCEELEELARACPHALVLVDHAYVEFCDQDFTARAVALENVVVTRTFSKALGLAGARVGYAVASKELIEWLETAGHPYAVSGLSIEVARRWLREGQEQVAGFIDTVKQERVRLQKSLEEGGARVLPSGANFLFAFVEDGTWWRDGLAGQGIAIRAYPGVEGMEGAIRIACPGNEAEMERLERAIQIVGRPEAILFDLDGVFADVSSSYREAIVQTAASFGVAVNDEQIRGIKARGNANNDWRVTQELLAAAGVDASLEEVTRRFEELYQGSEDKPGLWQRESMLVSKGFLEELAARGVKIGIVTGRPRKDADRFLDHFEIREFFEALVCMEDGPLKPDPWPVEEGLRQLGVERAFFVGDTPDDMRAGRAAGVLPLGICAPGDGGEAMEEALLSAGAGRVLGRLEELIEVLG